MNEKTIKKYLLCILFLLAISGNSALQAQNRIAPIRQKLDSLTAVMPGLLQPVDLSVSDVSVGDFIRGLAISNNVNVAINGDLNDLVENNFSGVKVIDVFVFLCDNHKLTLKTIGNIIVFSKFQEAPTVIEPYVPKKPEVSWNRRDSLLSYDLQNDSLVFVAKEISQLTGTNILLSPEVRNKRVNGFIQNAPLLAAIEKLAFMNDLSFKNTPDGYLELTPVKIEKQENASSQKQNNASSSGNKSNNASTEVVIVPTGTDNRFDISAQSVPISDIISVAAVSTDNPCIQLSEVKDKVSLLMKNVSFDDLLEVLLNGSSATFKNTGNAYVIGEKNNVTLKSCRVVQFQHRSVIDLSKSIPDVFKQNITVTEFPELNSLIICGAEPALNSFSDFLRDIDKNVPQVLIEVIIIDQQKNHTVSTGVKAGIGDAPVTTEGQLFPAVDMTLGADAVNSLINSINGFGAINLGRVTQNFYLSLSAMETNGQINIRSTPRLSTLNGIEATMSIGNTEYYLEESTNVIGTQNPQTLVTNNYKSVQADFFLKILPIAHGDDQVTLQITVEQSDFTARISPDAPPGKVTRKFTSNIRIRNQEMILLGGLEEKTTNDTGEGTPFLARIPVIKWLFSSRNKMKSKTRLSIFIRPTIIY